MTREQYESLPLAELKEIAKARGMKGTSAMKKKDLIELFQVAHLPVVDFLNDVSHRFKCRSTSRCECKSITVRMVSFAVLLYDQLYVGPNLVADAVGRVR